MRKVTVGTFSTTDKMRELVGQVLDSGRISYGPMCKELERRFADEHDCLFGVLSNSGTSSLQVALQALKELEGWSDGDEVIIPSVTFVATANVVLHNNLEPVLVDVDDTYYELDPTKLEEAITPFTRAVVPVHLFGQPADMEPICDIAFDADLAVIEDSCECMFVNYKGLPAGSIGDIGCFSTYVAHLLTTGVGGIAITDNDEYAVKMRSLVNHGRDGIYISIDDNNTDDLQEVVSRRFNFESVGHSFRITELEAALGVAQLDGMPDQIKRRQENAVYLTDLLRDLEYDGYLQLPKIRPNTEHAFMMYPILTYGDKWPLCNHLEEHGIETREMLPLTNQPCYRGLFDDRHYPVASMINDGGFYIGCHQELSTDDFDYVAEVMNDFFS